MYVHMYKGVWLGSFYGEQCMALNIKNIIQCFDKRTEFGYETWKEREQNKQQNVLWYRLDNTFYWNVRFYCTLGRRMINKITDKILKVRQNFSYHSLQKKVPYPNLCDMEQECHKAIWKVSFCTRCASVKLTQEVNLVSVADRNIFTLQFTNSHLSHTQARVAKFSEPWPWDKITK